MAGFVFHTENANQDHSGVRKPSTDYNSQQVMLAGGRHDTIEIKGLVREIAESRNLPNELKILQRTTTYFGPKLRLIDDAENEFLLTAPGPDNDLFLWGSVTNEDGFRECWEKQAEVKATFSDDQERYHLCPNCNEPLKTADHERMAMLGDCRIG